MVAYNTNVMGKSSEFVRIPLFSAGRNGDVFPSIFLMLRSHARLFVDGLFGRARDPPGGLRQGGAAEEELPPPQFSPSKQLRRGISVNKMLTKKKRGGGISMSLDA